MSKDDFVTCIFDLIFVIAAFKNIQAILRDKQLKGFDWRNVVLYIAWNLWSISVIYPAANLYWANFLNMVLVFIQASWISLVLYYKKHPKL